MNGLWYLVAAYGMIWAALFVYVFSIERRQRRLRDELIALESGATAAEPVGSDGATFVEVGVTPHG